MDNAAVSQYSLESLSSSPAGQGLALLCWAAVVALGWLAWRRRRGSNAADLLIAGGLWLVARMGLLVAGLPVSGRPDADWLTAALDLAGLVLLAWPFLAPPLPVRQADQLAGIGLTAVALMCGVSLWQWVRGWLGLPPTPPQPTITWAHSALALAGLAALNLLRRPTHRRGWLLTVAGTLLAGIGGPLILPPVIPPLSSILTAATATLAAAWLTWLERPQRRDPSPALPHEERERERDVPHLLEASASLFAAPDLAQLLKAAAVALTHTLEVQATALLLAEDENPLRLRLVARWPQADNPGMVSPFPPESTPVLADALTRGQAINVTRKSDRRRLEPLDHLLGAKPKAALILPLLPPPSQGGLRGAPPPSQGGLRGVLVLGHDGSTPGARQLQLCRILADQVATATNYIQLRARIGQQARSLARLVRHQEQESGQSRAVLESIADGVIVSDANDQVVLTNSAALDILGREQSDVLGHPFGQIVGCMVPAGEVGIIGALTDVSSYSMEAVFQVADRVVQVSMAPVENDGGTQLGVVAVLRDITALARAEAERERLLADLQEHSRQLEEATEQLRKLDRLKSQFIANMSHELRTPLNHIIGFSGMMLKEMSGPLTDMQRQDLEAIQKGGKHLQRLITNILDISQIWAGKIELTLSNVDLPEMIEDAMSAAAPLIEDKPIELEQALAPDVPVIRADKMRARQVLLNLLTNAIQYTERGQVTVSASRDGDCVVIGVADTGIGISPEYIETIFDEFSRVDNSSTRKVDGLGLGLSISRQLVELHGGQIWVESEVGVGSTFYFSLPLNGGHPAVM